MTTYTNQVAAVATTASGETIVATGEIPPNLGGTTGKSPVINGVVNITAGAGTTAVVVRVRQGANTTSGTLVGVATTHTLAAAAVGNIPFEVLDTANQFGAIQYTLTVQQTGGTGAGTVNQATIKVSDTQ